MDVLFFRICDVPKTKAREIKYFAIPRRILSRLFWKRQISAFLMHLKILLEEGFELSCFTDQCMFELSWKANFYNFKMTKLQSKNSQISIHEAIPPCLMYKTSLVYWKIALAES